MNQSNNGNSQSPFTETFGKSENNGNNKVLKCPDCGGKIKPNQPECSTCYAEFYWGEGKVKKSLYSICPKCQEEIEAFIPKCPHCEAEFKWESSDIDKKPKKKEKSAMKFRCPKCKTIIEGKIPKCPNCGVPFSWD